VVSWLALSEKICPYFLICLPVLFWEASVMTFPFLNFPLLIVQKASFFHHCVLVLILLIAYICEIKNLKMCVCF